MITLSLHLFPASPLSAWECKSHPSCQPLLQLPGSCIPLDYRVPAITQISEIPGDLAIDNFEFFNNFPKNTRRPLTSSTTITVITCLLPPSSSTLTRTSSPSSLYPRITSLSSISSCAQQASLYNYILPISHKLQSPTLKFTATNLLVSVP